MFLKNCWYVAGWQHEVNQSRSSLVTRQIAGERILLYQKPDGGIVAMEDVCPHRLAALSLGRKEGDTIRCMYHGMRYGPDGRCVEVPGQDAIPANARVRTYPVEIKNSCIWIWMGDPAKADTNLICDAVGFDHPKWSLRWSKMHVKTNYRQEIANLADLSHISFVHETTVGGSPKYAEAKPEFQITPRGLNTKFWARKVPAAGYFQHLFAPGALFDVVFDIQHTVPCNWIMNYRVYSPGTNTEGDSDGQLLLDTMTCQYVTPCDEDSLDYYFAWGPSKATEFPGLAEMLREATEVAFKEDALQLEAQHLRQKENPNRKLIDTSRDAGPGKMLWVLDKLLKQEAEEAMASPLKLVEA